MIKVEQSLKDVSSYLATLESVERRELYLKCIGNNNALKRNGFPMKRKGNGRKRLKKEKTMMFIDEFYMLR